MQRNENNSTKKLENNERTSMAPHSHGMDEKARENNEFLPNIPKRRSNSDLARYSTEKAPPNPKDVVDLTKFGDSLKIAESSADGANGILVVNNTSEEKSSLSSTERPVSPTSVDLEKKAKLKSYRQHSIESEHSGVSGVTFKV